MNTVKPIWIIAFTLLLTSQWLSYSFLTNTLAKSNNHTALESSNKKNPEATPINQERTTNISLSSNDIEELKKTISLLIKTEVVEIKNSVAVQTSSNHLETEHEIKRDINKADLEQTEEAYSIVSVIMSDVEIGGRWDKRTNAELAPYIDQLTPTQRREIMSAYVRAFRNGEVEKDVIPPF